MSHAKIDEALELFYSGDSAGAEVLLQEAGNGKLEPPPHLPPLDEAAFFEALGSIRLVKKDAAGAESAFRRMIELEAKGGAEAGGHATSHAKLGEALALADKHEESLKTFDKAVEMKLAAGAAADSLLGMLYRYSETLFHKGKYKDAADRFEKAAHYAEKSGATDEAMANILLYQAEALKHYSAPLFSSMRMQKNMQGGNAAQVKYLEQELEGMYRKAIAGYQHAAESAEKAGANAALKLQIQRAMAEMHHDAGRFVKAVMARKKVIQLAETLKLPPLELGFMHHGLGESTKEMNQPAEAADSYRKSIALKDKGGADAVSMGKSWYALGECLGASKKLDAALEAFTKARDLEDKSGATDENHKMRRKRYWGAVAMCLEAAGKTEEAKTAKAAADAI